jgi:hypothetical protein
MKRLFLPALAFMAATFAATSCRMATKPQLGDTVDAKVFEPEDTAAINKAARAKAKALAAAKDSVGIYYIGTGSTATTVQLVSYPSRRDTALYVKARHIKVDGNADFGHVVRARFWVSDRGDTLVTRLEEVKTEQSRQQ